ncbi:ABC transporter ATP-binding protein [Imperialibacter roseus]|uniref:ABC transporter ATP-binding protein n=1 Tax=Imperialibacter roseus TaxID=1324217 RepID=A0ABZ0IPS2_9BACT|nr:ABC transporter ATP-binding protein [Imperialibacter roseus]WOK06990.1 ABC transporter ATP-binding protein [Imperialibacter roseus]
MIVNNRSVMKLQHLSVGYLVKSHPTPLLKDINLDINPGEVVCLLGQNGVGKSTLLRTIAGLQPPLAGEVLLAHRPVQAYSIQELATKISLVLTEKVGGGNLTVEELVALGRHPYTNWLGLLSKEDKSAVEEAVALTKINYLLNKKVGELSDGQYQKAMIARAVAQDGDLMILDEPTAFLDLNNSVEIFMLLRQLALEKEKAVVVSTHDFHLAMEFADRLWLTNFNSPLVQGLPEDLALNGLLEESLYHEGFGFDLLNGRVLLPTKEGTTFSLAGDSPAHNWTKRALERHGYLPGDTNAAIKLTIEMEGNATSWVATNQRFHSLESLLNYLAGPKSK